MYLVSLDSHWNILSNDDNFISTIFIYLKQLWSKKKHIKRGCLVHQNGGNIVRVSYILAIDNMITANSRIIWLNLLSMRLAYFGQTESMYILFCLRCMRMSWRTWTNMNKRNRPIICLNKQLCSCWARPVRPTSFKLLLMHKPAYGFRWGETVVERGS
jgi:hypothetical protein